MNKSLKNCLGLAQIPLMIMLLLMAIAVPVATKYVQESNLDTRNLAAGKTGVPTKAPTAAPKGLSGGTSSKTCSSQDGYFRSVAFKCVNGEIANYSDHKILQNCCKAAAAPITPGGYVTGGPQATGGTSSKTCASQGGQIQLIAYQCDNNISNYSDRKVGFRCCDDDSTRTPTGGKADVPTKVPTIPAAKACTSSAIQWCKLSGKGCIPKPNGGNLCSGVYVTPKPTADHNDIVCCSLNNKYFETDEIDCRGRAGSIASSSKCLTAADGAGCYCEPYCGLNNTCYHSDLFVPGAELCGASFCKTAGVTKTPTCPACYGVNKCFKGACTGPDAICKATHNGDTTCYGSGTYGDCICGKIGSARCYDSNGVFIPCSQVHTGGGTNPTVKPTVKPTNKPAIGQLPTPTPDTGGGGPTVEPTVPETQLASVLNYQISFGGVNPTSAQCVVNWPMQFIVLAAGESRVYSDVVASLPIPVGNKLVFSGNLPLTGFQHNTGIAVFIKGPKHLQVKYGKDNQTDAYNQAGGEINIPTDVMKVFNFSDYPLMPGDVVGLGTEEQDGVINGVDFAYVKTKSLVHETVAEGGYLKGDLDGNCQVNSNDVNLLKISLQDKQGQLY